VRFELLFGAGLAFEEAGCAGDFGGLGIVGGGWLVGFCACGADYFF